MRNFDLSPLYRSAIGFDRLFNLIESGQNQGGGYPHIMSSWLTKTITGLLSQLQVLPNQSWTLLRMTTCCWSKVRMHPPTPGGPIYIRALPNVISNANFSWRSIFK